MSLIVDNPDWQGVRENIADEEIDFWEIPDPVSTFFPRAFAASSSNVENAEAEELELLAQDYRRVNHEATELCELIPANKAKYLEQLNVALDKIERAVKKLLGNRVKFVPNTTK